MREKSGVYVGFIDLEKMYDRGNREALWQVLGGKLVIGINTMYVDSLACVRVKGGESEQFRIDIGVRQGCMKSPLLFNVNMDTVMKEVKMGRGRRRESGDYLTSCMQMTWFCVVS